MYDSEPVKGEGSHASLWLVDDPVHQGLLTKDGIFNLENLKLAELAADGVYEFLFVFTPVPFKGRPARPVGRSPSARAV